MARSASGCGASFPTARSATRAATTLTRRCCQPLRSLLQMCRVADGPAVPPPPAAGTREQALREAAAAVCFGCRHEWPLVEHGQIEADAENPPGLLHVTPGGSVWGKCAAQPIIELLRASVPEGTGEPS